MTTTDTTAAHAEQEQQAQRLAAALGPDWAAVDHGHQDEAGRREWHDWRLHHTNGMELDLSWPSYPKPGRLRIAPSWPHQKNHGAICKPHDAPDLAITVDRTKPVAQIAKDIQRRLVEPFRPWYFKAWQLKQEREAREDLTAQNIERIVQEGGAHRPSNGATGLYLGADSYAYRLDVSDESVRFEHFTCPIDVAIRVLAILRKPDPIEDLKTAAMEAEERFSLDELEEYARTHPKGGS